MASDLKYSSIIELENLLLVDIDSTFEAQVEEWISAAELYVNGYTGYTTASGFWNEQITNETIEARVDGGLNLIVYPRKRPINSISSLQLWKGSESMTLSLTDSNNNTRYILPAQNNCIIYPNHEMQINSSTISITSFADIKYSRWYTKMSYIAGYTAIPKDVVLATTMITADSFMRHANKEGLVSLTQGRISKRWPERYGKGSGKSDLISDAENLLSGYKISSGWW